MNNEKYEELKMNLIYNNVDSVTMTYVLETYQLEGIDLSEYAYMGYDQFRLAIIKRCLQIPLDPTPLLNIAFTYEQMSELLRAMRKGIDVSSYADPSLTEMEMMGYTTQALTGVDVRKFFLRNFNNDQIYEILVGIENGIDYTKYADETLSADEMAKIKESLFIEKGVKVADETEAMQVF